VTRVSGIRLANREAVYVRDQYGCLRCGLRSSYQPYSVHHRLPRGRGGTDRLSGLALVCGTGTSPGCHQAVESARAQAYLDGWLVRTGADPAAIPVKTWAGWRHLTDDGRSITPSQYVDEATVRRAVHQTIQEQP
jgi:hypothetical protein